VDACFSTGDGGLLDGSLSKLRVRDWQRLQEHGIDHAEDGAVCADPERKGENGDDTEARGIQQHSKGVAKVSHEIADF
jgi:hypothetical protein